MASLRETRRRITSVKNTRQITRAMKLVAGAKLRRATDAALAAKPYQDTLQRVLSRVTANAGDVEHPLLATPNNTSDVIVIVMSSDRGLCGAFNSQLLRSAQGNIDALIADGKSVQIYAYGKKAVAHFQSRGYTVAATTIEVAPEDYAEEASRLAQRLMTELGNDGFERVILAFNAYQSVMVQEPTFEQILPMALESGDESVGSSGDFIYEPTGEEILGRLLPMSLRTRLFQALLETQAGEQASRMAAMDNATRNASELIDSLTLVYNRARQAAITTELTEIVSGAEAL